MAVQKKVSTTTLKKDVPVKSVVTSKNTISASPKATTATKAATTTATKTATITAKPTNTGNKLLNAVNTAVNTAVSKATQAATTKTATTTTKIATTTTLGKNAKPSNGSAIVPKATTGSASLVDDRLVLEKTANETSSLKNTNGASLSASATKNANLSAQKVSNAKTMSASEQKAILAAQDKEDEKLKIKTELLSGEDKKTSNEQAQILFSIPVDEPKQAENQQELQQVENLSAFDYLLKFLFNC